MRFQKMALTALATIFSCGPTDLDTVSADDSQTQGAVSATSTPRLRTSRYAGSTRVGNDTLQLSITLEYVDVAEVFDLPLGFACHVSSPFAVKVHVVARDARGVVRFEGDRQGDLSADTRLACTNGLTSERALLSIEGFEVELGSTTVNLGQYGAVLLKGGALKLTTEGQNAYVSGYDPASLELLVGGSTLTLQKVATSTQPAAPLWAAPTGTQRAVT